MSLAWLGMGFYPSRMARKLPAGPWRFYVYAVGDVDAPTYIGKGSGRRATVSARRFREAATELARFARERDAYDFEVQAIADLAPIENRHRGGNGSRATPVRAPRLDEWDRECARCGTRLMAGAILAEHGVYLTKFGRLSFSVK